MAEQAKLLAALCTGLTWIGFLIALITKKDDSYVMHYGKQGLALTIAVIVVMILQFIVVFLAIALMFIPVVGGIIGLLLGLLMMVAWLAIFVLWVWGIVNAFSGQKKSLPIIGMIADKLPF